MNSRKKGVLGIGYRVSKMRRPEAKGPLLKRGRLGATTSALEDPASLESFARAGSGAPQKQSLPFGIPHSAFRTSAGFTLMEIMVTLAILGAGLFVVLNGFYSSLRLRDTAIDATVRRELGQRAVGLAEAQVLAGTLSEAGDFGTRYPDYTWNYDAVLAAGDDGLIQLYEVEVTVTGPEEEDTLSFLVYNTGPEEEVPAGGSGGAR